MTDIVLDLDDGLIHRLKLTAALKGRTLEEEIRAIIERAAPLAPEERVSLSDRIRSMQAKPSGSTNSLKIVRSLRRPDTGG